MIFGFGLGLLAGLTLAPRAAQSADFIVYGVYRPLDLGNPGEVSVRDFYINMGAANGLAPGSTVDVMRKMPTYDLEAQKLMTDVDFKIASLKVIHVEQNAAIARIDKILPVDETPAYAPRAIMVGDLVRRR